MVQLLRGNPQPATKCERFYALAFICKVAWVQYE